MSSYAYGDNRPTVLVDPSGLDGEQPDCSSLLSVSCLSSWGRHEVSSCVHSPACLATQAATFIGPGTLVRGGLAARALWQASRAAKAGAPSRAWPSTAGEMDELLRVPGKRIPDGPMTPGRGKVVWEPNSKTKISFEQHPYHPNAPDWHRGPHWHVDTPGKPHQRYVPGDPIPGYDNP